MAKKILITFGLLAISATANAGLISFNGYEREANSNVVIAKKSGLEWLMWNNTTGLSITEAKIKYSADGWVLASNYQVSALFSDFRFESDHWLSDITSGRYSIADWSIGESSSFDNFIELFGATGELGCSDYTKSCFSKDDRKVWASALYGDPYGPSFYRSRAAVESDYTEVFHDGGSALSPNTALLTNPLFTDRSINESSGVAFIRYSQLEPTPVPISNSVGFLALGITILAFSRRVKIAIKIFR